MAVCAYPVGQLYPDSTDDHRLPALFLTGECTFGHSWAVRFRKRHNLPTKDQNGRKRKRTWGDPTESDLEGMEGVDDIVPYVPPGKVKKGAVATAAVEGEGDAAGAEGEGVEGLEDEDHLLGGGDAGRVHPMRCCAAAVECGGCVMLVDNGHSIAWCTVSRGGPTVRGLLLCVLTSRSIVPSSLWPSLTLFFLSIIYPVFSGGCSGGGGGGGRGVQLRLGGRRRPGASGVRAQGRPRLMTVTRD